MLHLSAMTMSLPKEGPKCSLLQRALFFFLRLIFCLQSRCNRKEVAYGSFMQQLHSLQGSLVKPAMVLLYSVLIKVRVSPIPLQAQWNFIDLQLCSDARKSSLSYFGDSSCLIIYCILLLPSQSLSRMKESNGKSGGFGNSADYVWLVFTFSYSFDLLAGSSQQKESNIVYRAMMRSFSMASTLDLYSYIHLLDYFSMKDKGMELKKEFMSLALSPQTLLSSRILQTKW